ncbi:MAG: hypothetical protein HY308_00305 [Gammaproteobacteria bacterium]|nr:hypothetical protein [Gammaproteobacteria bacterium]
MTVDYVAAKEKFDNFLMSMDDQLDALEAEAQSRNIDLDFSTASVSKLENLFDLMATNADKETIESLVVTFARYLGEIVRLNYGGKWLLPLDDPSNVYFNTPVITGHTKEGLEFSPIFAMRAFALRRKPDTLKKAIDAHIKPNPIDLSRLIEKR